MAKCYLSEDMSTVVFVPDDPANHFYQLAAQGLLVEADPETQQALPGEIARVAALKAKN